MNKNDPPVENGIAPTDDEPETCPNGSEWCHERPEGALSCFACFEDERVDEEGEGA